ncbi:MAG: hypothetical protein HIU82_03745 [Proteobacteria bacterium]|nr:hypothetical protein [Pseudomonadota bacterium]
MRAGHLLALLLLAFTAPILAAPILVSQAHACSVERRAVLPIQFRAGHPLVTALLDGQPATFVFDTGAQRSLLTPAAVARLHLKLDPWVGTTVVGIGGIEQHRNAEVASLVLGGVALRQDTMLRGLSVSVGAIPVSQMGGAPVDGILGRDVLAAFDLSLDFAHRRVTLYRVRGCTGRFLPWRGPYAAVAAMAGYRAPLGIPVRTDGHVLRALIDTGSTTDLLTASGMARLGLTEAGLAGEPVGQVRGIGPRRVRVRVYRLGWLAVGASVTQGVAVVAAPVILTPILDLLLGVDWLDGHRVWLSYATGQVFVAG